MARLSNEDIKKMSINEATDYAYKHPAESGRVSKIFGKASFECGKISIQYNATKLFTPNPSKVTVDLNN